MARGLENQARQAATRSDAALWAVVGVFVMAVADRWRAPDQGPSP